MKRRFIAALLLFSLVGWANSAAFCLSALTGMVTHVATTLAAHSGHNHHPCCPRVTAKPVVRVWAPSSLPCETGHRCCFVQNPQIPSNLPSRSENSRADRQMIAAASVLRPDVILAETLVTPEGIVAHSPSLLSTVLRI